MGGWLNPQNLSLKTQADEVYWNGPASIESRLHDVVGQPTQVDGGLNLFLTVSGFDFET